MSKSENKVEMLGVDSVWLECKNGTRQVSVGDCIIYEQFTVHSLESGQVLSRRRSGDIIEGTVNMISKEGYIKIGDSWYLKERILLIDIL